MYCIKKKKNKFNCYMYCNYPQVCSFLRGCPLLIVCNDLLGTFKKKKVTKETKRLVFICI